MIFYPASIVESLQPSKGLFCQHMYELKSLLLRHLAELDRRCHFFIRCAQIIVTIIGNSYSIWVFFKVESCPVNILKFATAWFQEMLPGKRPCSYLMYANCFPSVFRSSSWVVNSFYFVLMSLLGWETEEYYKKTSKNTIL